MSDQWILDFFIEIGVMLLAAFLAGEAARRAGQPPVLGEIIGGVLLGPSIFGMIAPGLQGAIFFPTQQAHLMVSAFVNFGMLYFLFVAGMEVDLPQVRAHGRVSLLTSILGMLVPFALGAASVLLLPGLWRFPGQGGLLFAVFVGTAMSISALPVIVRILMDLGLTRTRQGQIIVTSAIVSDLAGWSLFAYVLGMMTSSGGAHPVLPLLRIFLLGAGVILAGRLLGNRLVSWSRKLGGEAGSLLATVSISILAGALAAARCGVHPVFGAFLVGVALGPAMRHTPCAEVVIRQFAVSLFAPLYFVSIGLRLDFARSFDPLLVAVVVLIAFAGKLLGAGFGARLGGLRSREVWTVALGLNARGAVEIILAGVALSSGIIDDRLFMALVLMALVTTMASVPALRTLSRSGAVPSLPDPVPSPAEPRV